MIDLKKEFEAWCDTNEAGAAAEYIMKGDFDSAYLMIWQAAAERYQPKWISVEDEPLLNEKVLLLENNKRIWTGKRVGAEHYLLSNIDKEDTVHWRWFSHWMPLPAPKEQDDE